MADGVAGGVADRVDAEARRSWLLTPALALAEARGNLFPWVPVFLGLGIALWFLLPDAPGQGLYAAAGVALAAAGLLAWKGPFLARPAVVALGCLAAGFLAAGLRAEMVRAPMLAYPYYGPVTGRIVNIDRSRSDALRVTLDQVALSRAPSGGTPAAVRLSLHGPPPGFGLTAGQVVTVTARLTAPSGPEEPGGFDFRQMAFFERLGAVGYSRLPVTLKAPAKGMDQAVARLRLTLSHAIEAAIPGDPGTFASAAMTGDRSGVGAAVVNDLRVASLAHLVAISGMHMGLLVGFVFALVRGGLALVPALALRLNTRKVAAGAAFAVAVFYLTLSGAHVSTMRAFLMMGIFLGAVMLDRRALSLRNVALSATILLLWQPESLLGAGFQLSYAATVALIAGFEAARNMRFSLRLPVWARWVAGLAMTSVIAGLATAPYAAADFNRIAHYGLLANVLAVPAMSVVIGAGAMAAMLAPLGLAGLPLWAMGRAAAWILWVAHMVAGLGGAMSAVVTPMPLAMAVLTLGACWLVLWQGRARRWGAVAMALAFGLWWASPRPVALVSSDGALVGLMSAKGRALSAPRGAGFAARTWLQGDGDMEGQKQAALRPGFSGPPQGRVFTLAGVTGTVLKGKRGLRALQGACAKSDFVILQASQRVPSPAPGPCRVIGAAYLRKSGALSLEPAKGGLWIRPVRRGHRIWDAALPLAPPIFLPAKPARMASQ